MHSVQFLVFDLGCGHGLCITCTSRNRISEIKSLYELRQQDGFLCWMSGSTDVAYAGTQDKKGLTAAQVGSCSSARTLCEVGA